MPGGVFWSRGLLPGHPSGTNMVELSLRYCLCASTKLSAARLLCVSLSRSSDGIAISMLLLLRMLPAKKVCRIGSADNATIVAASYHCTVFSALIGSIPDACKKKVSSELVDLRHSEGLVRRRNTFCSCAFGSSGVEVF